MTTNPTTLRRRRAKLDEAVTKAFTPLFHRVIKKERARVKAATSQGRAIAAVRTSEWVAACTTAWLSDPVIALWSEQQAALGLELPMPKEIRAMLGKIGTEHGRSIADTRRDRVRARFEDQ